MEPCLICRAGTIEKRDRTDKLYHICQNCGFTFLNRANHLSEAEEKARYDLHNNDGDDMGYQSWLRSFLEEAVLPFADKGSRILDFGSGPSPVLAELMRVAGFRVEIYDKYFAPSFPGGKFDVITSSEVFEHLADPASEFEQLIEKLTPRGYIVLRTSFRPEKDEDFFHWWYREDSTHISFFTERALEQLAENRAMTVVYTNGRSVSVIKRAEQ
jgi:2-polyprenyl-3-methyl-5-hydroxy-6-metoxy-1,4-benzoquinol methylase